MRTILFIFLAATISHSDVVYDRQGTPVANGKAKENGDNIEWISCNGKKAHTFSKHDGFNVEYGDTCREPNTEPSSGRKQRTRDATPQGSVGQASVIKSHRELPVSRKRFASWGLTSAN